MASNDPRVIALKDLRKTVNGRLLDASIRHAVYKEGLTGKEAQYVVRFIEREILPDLMRKIEFYIAKAARGANFGLWSANRINDQMKAHYQVMRQVISEFTDRFSKRLQGLAGNEARWQSVMINQSLPAGLSYDLTLPTVKRMAFVVNSAPFEGRVLKKHFSRFSARIQKDLNSAVKVGILEGETIPQTGKKIRHIYSKTRHTRKTIKRHAETLAITATNHVQNRAAIEMYKDNRDILDGWLFVATLDAGTTDICMSLDGQVFKIGEGGHNYPPLHFRCRSVASPQVKSWKDLGFDYKDLDQGQRAALGGPVPAKVKGPDWMAVQPDKVQDSFFGKRYAELFRSGEMTYKEIMAAKGVKKSALALL
jgi:SPP1 gp7 family putative phage head morphogenesis protein